jgi:F0F1-type ATP synthase membrane subunit b/b'
MKKNLLSGLALMALLVLAGVAVAQRPVENIDARRHPHLASAQKHIIEAYQETETARTDNHYDLGGHAEKAAELLAQADRELKEAAEFGNAHPRK